MAEPQAVARPRTLLVAIVVAAAVLRLFPIWFGLAYPQARPDEETAIGHAVQILHGDPNPHFFHWPSLTFYLLAGVFWLASLVRRMLSLPPALSGLEMVLIARAVVAVAGTATIVVLYRMGHRLAGEAVGLLAALLLAVAVLHVRDSHFAMTDVLMTLLVLLSLALLLSALELRCLPALAGRHRSSGTLASAGAFAAAGLAGGLAASTKYSAAALLAAMGVAQIQLFVERRDRPWHLRGWMPSILFGVAFVCAFFAATPYALLDYPAFRTDLAFDFSHLSGGHAKVNLGRGWTYHLLRSLPYGTGVTIFFAAVAGLVPAARHYGRRLLVPAAFFAAFYGALGNGTTVFFRYILPLVPLVCLSAAIGVHHGARWMASTGLLGGRASLALLVVLVAGPALAYSAWMDLLLARTDTRVLAAEWLKERLRPEDTLHDAGSFYTQLRMDSTASQAWRYDPVTGSFGAANGGTPDWLVLYRSPVGAYTWAPASLRDLASTRYRLVHTVNGPKGTGSGAVYDLQDAFFLPVSGFHTVERPGPTVLIYRRDDRPAR